jgi:hypothetical protein
MQPAQVMPPFFPISDVKAMRSIGAQSKGSPGNS